MNTDTKYNEDHEATYCPEDDKIRLYVGRVPREEYLELKAAGYIGDEDQSPTDRAADRAERFGGYLDKRRAEALGAADNYESGPSAHGYANAARAERAARKHDRMGTYATIQWAKAEYWQDRTAGVIRNALYKSTPGVRIGRIKKLEPTRKKMPPSEGAKWYQTKTLAAT